MPNAIIADDEPLLRAELQAALAQCWPELSVTAALGDGESALMAIDRHCPDIAFLDIRMPLMSGIEVAERAQGKTHIVFVSAYDDHAIDAFDKGAVDYLLKPLRLERLKIAIERLHTRLAQTPSKNDALPPLKRIQATTGNRLKFYPIDEIVCFGADSKYTRLLSASGDEALVRLSLTELLARLDGEVFWRINRSTIVNVDRIDHVVRDADGDMHVKMQGIADAMRISKAHQLRFRGM